MVWKDCKGGIYHLPKILACIRILNSVKSSSQGLVLHSDWRRRLDTLFPISKILIKSATAGVTSVLFTL